MKTSDITLSIFIILIFIVLYVFNVLSVGIQKIKDDWTQYRCNPIIMPFASVFGYDTTSNFSFCIQNMMSSYMGYLMQPVQYSFSVLGNISKDINDALTGVRAFFNNIRNYIQNTIESIFGVFLNILIEFQRVTINIKDIFGKLIGILATLMYTLEGTVDTMESAWSGPPGQLVRALCFHPDTKVELKDGSLYAMKDLPLNSILKTGSKVCAVMNISNVNEKGEFIEKLYSIDGGMNNEKILVSGSHLIYNNETKQFVHVEDLSDVIISDINSPNFACLITTDHIIPIGKHIFHDWEDNNGSEAKKLI
jgi:hypothetical protein